MPVLIMFEVRDEVFESNEALEAFITSNPFFGICSKWRYEAGEDMIVPDDYTRRVRVIYQPKTKTPKPVVKKTVKKVAPTKRTGRKPNGHDENNS